MKKLIPVIFLIAFGGNVAHAEIQFRNARTSVQPQIVEYLALSTPQDKKLVKPSDLPDKVQRALSSKKYEGWKVDKAYWDDDRKVYEIGMTNAAGDAKVVTMNKEGDLQADTSGSQSQK